MMSHLTCCWASACFEWLHPFSKTVLISLKGVSYSFHSELQDPNPGDNKLLCNTQDLEDCDMPSEQSFSLTYFDGDTLKPTHVVSAAVAIAKVSMLKMFNLSRPQLFNQWLDERHSGCTPNPCSDLMFSLTWPLRSRAPYPFAPSVQRSNYAVGLPKAGRGSSAHAAYECLQLRTSPWMPCFSVLPSSSCLPAHQDRVWPLFSFKTSLLLFFFFEKAYVRYSLAHLRMCFTQIPVPFQKVIFAVFLNHIYLKSSVVLFKMEHTPAYFIGWMRWRLLGNWDPLQVRQAGQNEIPRITREHLKCLSPESCCCWALDLSCVDILV